MRPLQRGGEHRRRRSGNRRASAADAAAAPRRHRAAGGAERAPPPTAQSGAVATLEAASTGEMHEPDEVGHGATREAADRRPRRPAGGNGNGAAASTSRPLAKRIAADKGIDLSQVQRHRPAAAGSSSTTS